MILMIEPIYKALVKIAGKKNLKYFRKRIKNQESRIKNNSKNKSKAKIILLSAKGKKFDQAMARKFSKLDRIIFICGRYEGIDERVAKYLCDDEISIGDYILTGGELPAMIITDAVTRLIPGTLGNIESLKEESFTNKTDNEKKRGVEYPQYTKPEIFSPNKKTKWRAPKVLLSGHHRMIKEWRENRRK